jgi:hypothetical protein
VTDAAVQTERPPRAPQRHAPPRARTIVLMLLLVVLLGQRFGVPISDGQQIPASLLLATGVLGVGLFTGVLVLDRQRALLYIVAMTALTLLTFVSLARQQDPSLLSVLFAISLYALATVRASVLEAEDVRWLLDAFVRIMAILAIVGIAHAGLQYVGVPYEDWFARAVPEQLTMQGYNTGDPISWDSPIYRTNGVVFLEPSFFSYFLGIAVVVALYRGHSVWTVSLLMVAIVPTLAGNGLVVVAAGIVALALGRHRRRLMVLVFPFSAAILLALATPLADHFVSRITEVTSPDSSSSMRLVQPYQLLWPAWLDDPLGVLLGNGAGSATDIVAASQVPGVLAPVLPKLFFEYGVIGAMAFLVFFLWALWSGGGERPWAAGILVSYLALNAAFLQETFALSTILFVYLLGQLPHPRPPQPAQPPRRPARSPDVRKPHRQQWR